MTETHNPIDVVTRACAALIAGGDPGDRKPALKILSLIETNLIGKRISAAKAARATKVAKPRAA